MLRAFQRFISGLVSVAMVLNPIALDARLYALLGKAFAPAWIFPMMLSEAQAQAVDPFLNAASLGQAAGGGQLSAPPLSGFDPNTQTFSIPSGSGVAQSITQDQLFKGSSDPNAQADFSNAVAAATANNDNGDHAAMLSLTDSLTNQSTGRLNTQPNSQGNAFQALRGSIMARSHPDMSNDPMLTVTKDVYSNTANLQNMLGNCNQSTTTIASTNTARVPDLQQCDRIVQPTSCNVDRVVTNVVETTSCVVGTTTPNYMPNLITGAAGETLCDPNRVDNQQAFRVNGFQIWTDVSAVNAVPVSAGTFPQWSSYTYRCNCGSWGGYCSICTGYNSVDVWSIFTGCTGNICSSTLYLLENLPAAPTWNNTYPSCPAGSVAGSTLASSYGWDGISYDANGNPIYVTSGFLPQASCYTSTNNGTTSVGNYFPAAGGGGQIPYYLVSTSLPNGVSGYTYLSPMGGYDPNNGYYPANVSVPLASIPSLTIQYDKPRIVRIVTDMIVETPPGCSHDSFCQAAPGTWTNTGSVNDQASTDNWECYDAANSRIFQGVDVTPDTAQGLSVIYPGVPVSPPAPICYKAQARNYSCNFNVGQVCFTDINGVQQCQQNSTTVPSTCDVLEQPTATRAACSFISSTCTLPDPVTGVCHNFTDTYDCGTSVTVPGASSSATTFVCPGQIRCVGTECVNPPTDTGNTDFTKVAALQSATAFMSTDGKCTTQGDCEIFKGEAFDCKKAVGGIQNCCTKPAGVSIVQYMSAAYVSWNVVKTTETVAMLQAQGTAVMGSISSFAQQAAPDVYNALTTAYSSIVGPSAAGSGAAAASLTAPLYQAMGTMLNSVAPGLGDAVFKKVGGKFSGGLSTAPGSLGSYLSTAMTAYMYVMIALLLIQIIWACEKREFELGAKRALLSCHMVGTYCSEWIRVAGKKVGCLVLKESYCCFSSPLARIMQEQGRPPVQSVGPAWGIPEMPDCRGFTMTEMSALNFDLMDLSEWVAILAMSGKIPQTPPIADANLTVNKLTSAQTPIAGATSPVDTPTTISTTLTANPTSGEAARSQVRTKMGF